MTRLATLFALVVISLITMGTPARADGPAASLSAGSGKAGDVVRVAGQGWPAAELIQFVTCGEGGVTGSAGCDTRAALATPVRADGTFVVDVQIGSPPRPCPCVVHITSVLGAPAVVDLPFALADHAVGAVPKSADPIRELAVQDARLTGGTAAAWFGAPDRLTLTYTIRNPSASSLVDATVQVRLGGGGNDSVVYQHEVENVGPGQSRTFSVPVELPLFAFGRYVVRADVSGLAPARLSRDAYPWGLLILNVAGLVLIAWGVLRRLRSRRVLAHADPAQAMLPAVVRLGSLGAFLVFDDAPGAGRLRRLAGAQLSLEALRELVGEPSGPSGGDSVLDLAALTHVLARRYPKNLSLFEEKS
ncbi:hypothetical protein AB0M02_11400 [Actinoplanes sp. NPDC051861]|uniref:hypothetical protein n=1 Tax=Actinoplanes sp. NPDC051861 TaxID=3155170 RepID=UPI00341E0F2A